MDLLSDDTPNPTATEAAAAAAAAAEAAAKTVDPPLKTAADAVVTGEKTWLDGLPEDLRSSPQLAKYKESGVEGVARAYIASERLIGAEKVPVPKDANDTEAWDRYYKAGGRPDEPSKYEFAKPEKLPEGVTYNEGMETWWRQAAHEAGLSNRQAGKLFEKYRDRTFGEVELSTKAVGAEVEGARLVLQRDWGNEFEARRALAKAAFSEMPQDVRDMAVRTGLARMPSFVKYLHDQKAKMTGETDPKGGERSGGDSPDALNGKISEHRTKYQTALMDSSHPEHELRTTELTALFNKLFPVEQVA